MDILGSIMSKMEGPPKQDEKQREQIKRQKESEKKQQEEKERRVKAFRTQISARIAEFSGDETQLRLVFEPMEKLSRAILHDIAETAGLLAHSFGTEDHDRHVIVFKPEGMPSEPELMALRRGEIYDPSAECQKDEHEDDDYPEGPEGKNNITLTPTRKRKHQPAEYLQKYEKHFGGLEVAKDAAQSTVTSNRTYGFVNSDLKKDRRTIEQTLADIRARKKQKVAEENETSEDL